MKNRRWVPPAVMSVMLVFYLFLAWSVPYSAIDDLQWGLDEGLHWLLDGTLNSRYVGNFFAVVMCRSQLVKTLVMGLSMFCIPLLMARLAPLGREGTAFLPAYLACNAGLLLTPHPVWRETLYWVCGFGNYGLSILLFLLWLLLLRRVEQKRTHLWAWAGGLFLLTLTMSLFLENQTALQLGGAVVLAVYALRDKELRPPFWACLAGTVLGILLMLSNRLYSDLAGAGTTIGPHEMTFAFSDGPASILWAILRQYVSVLLPQGFTRGGYLGLPMAVIVFCGFWNSRLRPLSVLSLWPLLYNCAALLRPGTFTGPAEVLGSAAAWLLPLAALAVQQGDRSQRLSRLLLCLAAMLVLFPLAATTTQGPRLYLFPYLLLILLAVHAMGGWLNSLPVAGLTAVLLAGLAVLWTWRCSTVLSCTQLRDKLTAQAVEEGRDTLILPTDRHQFIVWWMRNPESPEYADYYRRFHRIPEDVTLIFLPTGSYERWPNIPPELWEARIELAPSHDYVPGLP